MYTNYKDRLVRDLKTALAWGTPDNESTGYSHYDYAKLISRALNYIENVKEEDNSFDDIP